MNEQFTEDKGKYAQKNSIEQKINKADYSFAV